MFAAEEGETTSLLAGKKVSDPVEKTVTKPGRPVLHYAIMLTLIVGVAFLVVARNLPADAAADMLSSSESNRETVSIDTVVLKLSIVQDKKTGVTRLIDNAPILCRHSILSDKIACPEHASVELATAEYSVNLNGRGWNYMSIKAIDMLELKVQSTNAFYEVTGVTVDTHGEGRHPHRDQNEHNSYRFGDYLDTLKHAGDLSPVRQQYIRTMHSVGVLEGYLSCKEIGDWYANFYDGLFSGGEVNLPTMEFLEANHVWMTAQASLYWEVDDYWMAVKGLLAQLEGLLIGAQKGCPGVPLDSIGDDATDVNNYKGTSVNFVLILCTWVEC